MTTTPQSNSKFNEGIILEHIYVHDDEEALRSIIVSDSTKVPIFEGKTYLYSVEAYSARGQYFVDKGYNEVMFEEFVHCNNYRTYLVKYLYVKSYVEARTLQDYIDE